MGGLVKTKSIQELERGSMCVRSEINWSMLCKDVRASKCVVLSLFRQDENLALKRSTIIVNKKLNEAILLNSSSYCLGLETCRQHQCIFYKFVRKLQKRYIDWGFIISLDVHLKILCDRYKHFLVFFMIVTNTSSFCITWIICSDKVVSI